MFIKKKFLERFQQPFFPSYTDFLVRRNLLEIAVRRREPLSGPPRNEKYGKKAEIPYKKSFPTAICRHISSKFKYIWYTTPQQTKI